MNPGYNPESWHETPVLSTGLCSEEFGCKRGPGTPLALGGEVQHQTLVLLHVGVPVVCFRFAPFGRSTKSRTDSEFTPDS